MYTVLECVRGLSFAIVEKCQVGNQCHRYSMFIAIFTRVSKVISVCFGFSL